MKVLDCMKEPDDIVVLTSLTFFILVLRIPVFTLAQLQYMNLQSIVSLASLLIIDDILLVLLWMYIIKKRKKLMTEEELSKTNIRYLYSRLAVIPCLYVMSILIAFFGNIRLAVIFPVIIVPSMILLSRVFGSEKWRKKNTTHP
jgi:hypothetical protein